MQLNQQVQKANREAIEEGTKLDAHQLAEKLDLPGHTFKVRAALGGSWSGDCLRQLRHFFLTCSMTGKHVGRSDLIGRQHRHWHDRKTAWTVA